MCRNHFPNDQMFYWPTLFLFRWPYQFFSAVLSLKACYYVLQHDTLYYITSFFHMKDHGIYLSCVNLEQAWMDRKRFRITMCYARIILYEESQIRRIESITNNTNIWEPWKVPLTNVNPLCIVETLCHRF